MLTGDVKRIPKIRNTEKIFQFEFGIGVLDIGSEFKISHFVYICIVVVPAAFVAHFTIRTVDACLPPIIASAATAAVSSVLSWFVVSSCTF